MYHYLTISRKDTKLDEIDEYILTIESKRIKVGDFNWYSEVDEFYYVIVDNI